MWPFAARIVDDATVEWQLQAFEWLLTHLNDGLAIAGTTLVLPDKDHFASEGETGHALALRVFAQVKSYIRVDDDIVIDLVQQPQRRSSIVNERVALEHDQPEPLGTCRVNEAGNWEISYDPDLLKDPENLIPTFAHEIGHVLIPLSDELPVEPQEYEFLIDLSVAFFGFGVFLSNTRADRMTDGSWSWWKGGGYLPINDRLMATALFISLKRDERDKTAAETFLRPQWRSTFRKALRQLERFRAEIDRLRSLDRELSATRLAQDVVPSAPQT